MQPQVEKAISILNIYGNACPHSEMESLEWVITTQESLPNTVHVSQQAKKKQIQDT